MARRRRRRRKKSALDYIRLPQIDLDPDTKKNIFIVVLAILGSISFLGLIGKAAAVGVYLNSFLTMGFGWGKWLIPFILLGWAYFLYDDERFELRFTNYIGLILFILFFHGFLFLLIDYNKWPLALKQGDGGGYVGLILAKNLVVFMGYIATFILSIAFIIIAILLLFNTTLATLFGEDSLTAKILKPFKFVFAKLLRLNKDEDEDEEENEEDEDEEENEEDEDEDEEENEEDEDEDEENEEDEDEDDEGEVEKISFTSKPVKDKEGISDLWWHEPLGINFNIPLNLLSSKKSKVDGGDISENKEIIHKALENFGIPVEMGEVSVGPTVTQYTFKPSEGIKVSRIANLSNDLALALAKHPIRIEAPIPNKALVGVEVPNNTKALVSLRHILSSPAYKNRENNMMMALGKDVAGNSWLDDVTRMPHLLVAGATNSGKSVCLNSIIISLMYQNNPDELRFIMVDPKRVELTIYDRIPYLLTPVITEVNKTINALKWCLNEMDTRYDVLQQSKKKNIQTYNASAKIKMPYIIFIIDELADLMVAASKDIEAPIIRLAQMARAVGIHLILATQRPSVDVITGLIKANMPARIAFSVASSTDSRTILDSLGAEKLLGRGDMLFINAESSKPVRLQGAFLSDLEIKKITRYIKEKSGEFEYLENITDRQKVKGMGGIGIDGVKGDEDELLYEAKETIVNMGRASASLLQRKLRIGYARAASILDQLEEAGIIGPANGSKPREILLTKQQFVELENQGVSGVSIHDQKSAKAPDKYLVDEEEGATIFKEEDKDEEEDDEEDNNDEEDVVEEENEDNKNDEEEDGNIGGEDENNKEEEYTEDDEDEDDGKYFSR